MPEGKRVLALGFFDGIHLGHAALLNRALQIGEERGMEPTVMTFDTHPDDLVLGKDEVKLINSAYDRTDLIRRIFGIEDIIFLHFDENMMRTDWERFTEMLATDYRAGHLVAGDDFRFGYRGLGNATKLSEKCLMMGIGCDIIPEVKKNGRIISSTYIRTLISAGEMELAEEYLGHPYCLSDTVRHGYRIGRTIDAPTINMDFEKGVLIPAHGVYATWVYLENGSRHMGVTNVGVRPTVGGVDKVTAESNILNFDSDLYGQRVRIDFVSKLRNERKFANIEELQEQIHRDMENAKGVLISK